MPCRRISVLRSFTPHNYVSMLYGNDVTNARGCAFRRCKLKLRKCAVREQSHRGRESEGESGGRERALIKAHCNKEHFLFTLPRSGRGRLGSSGSPPSGAGYFYV